MDLATLTGAGGTVEIGGKLLTCRHLNAFDMGALQAFIKERTERPMQRFVRHARDLLPMKEFDPDGYYRHIDNLLLRAHEEEKNGDNTANAMDAMQNIEAIAYTLHLMTKQNHPDISFEWIRDRIKEDDLARLKTKIDFVSKAWLALAEMENANNPLPAPLPG